LVRRKNPEGEDYLQCKARGNDLYDVERHEPDIIGGFAGGGGGLVISTRAGRLAPSAVVCWLGYALIAAAIWT
jgi:hypothetical protein